MKKMRGIVVVSLTLVLVGGLAGAAWASGLFPSSETGDAVPVDLPASYRSEETTLSGSIALPPDEDPSSTTAPAGSPYALSSSFSYYTVSGATMRGRSANTEYVYEGNGCVFISGSSGSMILNTELHIPQGSLIKYIRLYFMDTSASSNVFAYLTRYQPGQGFSDLVATSSSTAYAGGWGYVVSPEMNETVDNLSYAYTLIGYPSITGTTEQICGIRVAYYAPLGPIAYLPAILK